MVDFGHPGAEKLIFFRQNIGIFERLFTQTFALLAKTPANCDKMCYSYFIFVAEATDIVRGENFESRGEILDMDIFQMWRYLRRGDISDVEEFEIYRIKDNIIHTVLPSHGWYLC